jgi:maltose/moltooligosaccharide transporter
VDGRQPAVDLDAANNITMEPYRAYVSDRLDPEQHAHGYLTQSAFTGLAQTLSYLAPSILVWLGMNKDGRRNHIPVITKISFLIGAVLSMCTIAYSIWRVPELPLTPQQSAEIAAKTAGLRRHVARDLGRHARHAPAMRQLAVMKLFQWYGMVCYWQYITSTASRARCSTRRPDHRGLSRRGAGQRPDRRLLQRIAFVAPLRWCRSPGASAPRRCMRPA